MDTSATCRKEVPLLFGMIKDSNAERSFSFLLMTALASFHNLSRSIGVSLFMAMSKRLTFAWILGEQQSTSHHITARHSATQLIQHDCSLRFAGEIALYNLYKVARRDHGMWIVGIDGWARVAVSIVSHTCLKVLVDFTGMIHIRGPKLMGGRLFSLLTVVNQMFPFFALWVYRRSEGLDRKNRTMSEEELDELEWGLGVLCCAWGACVVAFFLTIERGKWWTFISNVTGWQFTVDCFLKSNDPETKMLTIFENHSSSTASIKAEVIAYMHEHWAEWCEEKPEWFNAEFIARIDEVYIPENWLKGLGGGGRTKMRRRSSVDGLKDMLGVGRGGTG